MPHVIAKFSASIAPAVAHAAPRTIWQLDAHPLHSIPVGAFGAGGDIVEFSFAALPRRDQKESARVTGTRFVPSPTRKEPCIAAARAVHSEGQKRPQTLSMLMEVRVAYSAQWGGEVCRPVAIRYAPLLELYVWNRPRKPFTGSLLTMRSQRHLVTFVVCMD